MTVRRWRLVVLCLAVMVVGACATTSAVRSAETAAASGDYDSAVAYYRQALAKEPDKIELRIQLERTTRIAASEHIKRARELEAQDQLTGAMAEYRLAADLDPSSTLSASKAAELDRKIRTLVEAARPRPRIDTMREQAAQSSPIPRLDPRTTLPELRFSNIAVRDLLKMISDLTGINVTYDQTTSAGQLPSILGQPYTIDVRQMSLQDVLNQVMQATSLTFKVVNPQTIFVYQDTAQNRQKYEDQYTQTYFLSHSTPEDMQTLVRSLMQGSTGGAAPNIQVSKGANALVVKAPAPVLEWIDTVIRQNDRPVPEVMVEAEILEVDRSFMRQLGVDLSQFALGLTFSPELAPPNAATVPNTFPTQPPPFNLNTIMRGVSANDFYLTSPTALIKLLESNQTTKILAKPQSRGRAGEPMQLTLGDSVPIPNTSFNAAATGGVATVPVTSVTYQEVGINLQFTPRVTYQDEIILENLLLEKSALGNFLEVAGQSYLTIVRRRVTGSLRLRDGESNLIAGLLRDDDRKTLQSMPGIASIPILRSLFGSTETQVEQTDIVMIITPRIVRSRDLTPDDLKPKYVGAGQNIGGSAPALISPESIGVAPGGDAAAVGPPAGPQGGMALSSTPGAVNTPAAASTTVPPPPGVPPPGVAPTRAVGVVPIEAVPAGPTAAPQAQSTGLARVTLTAPTPGPDGSLAAGGGPFTVPITISGAPPLSTVVLTITYNPGIVRTPTLTQGSFMAQGGATPTFVPRIDTGTGRIDIALSRAAGQAGAAGSGLLAAIAFVAGDPGITDLTITGVATSASGQTVPLEFAPTRILVR